MAEDANKLVRDGIGGGGIEGNRDQAYRTADGMAAGLDMAIGGFPGGSDAAESFGKSVKRGFHDYAPTEWVNLYYENLEMGKISQTQYPTYQDYRRAVENNEIDINGKPLTPSGTPPDSNPSSTNPSSTNPSASDPRRNDPNVGILRPYPGILSPYPESGNNTGGSNPGGSNTGGSNPGGSNTGGSNPGGSNTGGSKPGGNNTGGSNPGGSNTGGSNPGGNNTGGSNPGGNNTGGNNSGASALPGGLGGIIATLGSIYGWGKAIKTWYDLGRRAFASIFDPIALDLNGNGIETLAANGHDGAMFDHERSGIRTATGWVHSNDGLLVHDRDGDGKITDGGEIFGDNTPLKNGQTAAHGFAALAELDDNGDGKVDAADKTFSKLGVWRDLNHNGISEEGEIFALKDLRIKSLNLGYTQADKDLGDGNTLAEIGSYTDEDGNEHIMGDLRLAADRFNSRYRDSIPLTDEQQQVPNLRGSGRVRDLREAAAQSPDVAAALQAYANAQTKEEQLALRDQLLRAWAGTDKRFTTEGVLAAATQKFAQASGNKGNAIPLTPGQLKELGTIQGPSIWSLLGIEDPDKKKKAALHEKIGILDAFTGTDSTHLYYGTKAQAQHTLDTIEKTYANLADNLYDGLLFQTRLKPYLNAIRFGMSEDGKLQLDYSDVSALFAEIHKKNPGKAFTDLGELLAKGNADGKNTAMAPLAEQFVQFAAEAEQNGTFAQYADVLGKKNLETLGHRIGTDGNDNLSGNESANYLSGENGDDILRGYGGNDVLNGGTGNDSLSGGDGDDVLNGEEGNDTLEGGTGHDTLDGGTGNDQLYGGNNESDTYLFRAGHGRDVITDYASQDEQADTLRFAGAQLKNAQFSREGHATLPRCLAAPPSGVNTGSAKRHRHRPRQAG